jgi:hypothetical protein
MNNTKALAILAVLTAATLVVGTLAATITQSAFAGGKKDKQEKYVMKGGDKQEKFKKMKGKDKQDTTYQKRPPPQRDDNNNTRDDGHDEGAGGNNDNGNTVTVQVNKQKASQSGWDNTQDQEGQNTICTHPSSSCVSEGSETPVNSTSSTDLTEHGGGGSHSGGGT